MNYDIICFQLRNGFYGRLESPLKKELDELSKNIKALLISGDKLGSQPQRVLSQVFNFRIKALKWLLADNTFDYLEALDDAFSQIEQLRTNEKLEVLVENSLFALRCNQRVFESMIDLTETDSTNLASSFDQFPEITYEQFIASLPFTNLDNDTIRKIVGMINASLHIEFGLVAVDIINDENLNVSETTINTLAFLIADAAQDYSAYATELGLLKQRSASRTPSGIFDKEFVNEQGQLADLGIEDWG